MANLDEAFNLNYTPKCKFDGYMDKIKKKINHEDQYLNNQNIIGNRYCNIDSAYDRVKVSNDKYDHITHETYKPVYGYICQDCGGPINYHWKIQTEFPHDFVRGEYRKLTNGEVI